MAYNVLKFFHLLGAVLMGGGLAAVWLADWRARQLRDLSAYAEAVRTVAVCYDGLVLPGSLLVLASGGWMIAQYYGGLNFVHVPWLAGMVVLFLVEFIEGNTVTRRYFMRLRRLAQQAVDLGRFTPELEQERAQRLPTFTHYLDLPVLILLIALGALKPDSWVLWWLGVGAAVVTAAVLTYWIRRRYAQGGV